MPMVKKRQRVTPVIDARRKGYELVQLRPGAQSHEGDKEKEVSMGIVWTILAIIGLIVVLQFIF